MQVYVGKSPRLFKYWAAVYLRSCIWSVLYLQAGLDVPRLSCVGVFYLGASILFLAGASFLAMIVMKGSVYLGGM